MDHGPWVGFSLLGPGGRGVRRKPRRKDVGAQRFVLAEAVDDVVELVDGQADSEVVDVQLRQVALVLDAAVGAAL